ncbi:thiamine-phosphate kinase [uncultured Roseibium sp.]|uniref:thiamine-phosphate kinase n=1 Tax=uncultured Roseibium sp. TaxID=1936171 RepID=UPI002610CAA5|nr:thiamine-phosphate kinase [uncultured Roseibium sp.]
MAQDRPGEFELIRAYFAPLANDPGSLGLTDDAAVLKPEPGLDLVLTKDVLASNVHFFADDAPEAIAAKALRVNLSDLAAKGAKPRGYLLGLALASDWTERWLERFCAGLSADQSAYDIRLLGGDTIRSNNGLQVSITAIGQVEPGKAVRRSGARSGDVLFVSGTIGDAAAGLNARIDPAFCERVSLARVDESHILDRYLLPRPRTTLAPLLVDHASAAMDVSDGLFADCGHLAKASQVGVEIDLSKVPVSTALRHLHTKAPEDFVRFLNGGDDYEILAAVPAEKAAQFSRQAERAGCPVTEIGRMSEEAGKVRVKENGRPVALQRDSGFRHF